MESSIRFRREKEMKEMKRWIVLLTFLVLLSAGIAFASGGQNQGTTGTGDTHLGDLCDVGFCPQDQSGR
jgi:hypothetical protein